VLPTRYLVACGKWFRLMIAGLLDELLQEGMQGDIPVLAILDEFAQLGRLGAIENAMSLAAGYGLQLWPILQNLAQLRELYGDRWETFLSGAGVRQFFTPRDIFTAEYMSKLCGVTTVRNIGHSSSEISKGQVENGFTGVNFSASDTQRPLLFPDEVMKLPPYGQLLFVDKVANPIKAVRAPYFEIADRRLKVLFDPDPYHASEKRKASP
jgi:type IV secretion system protein VirD4